MSIESVADQLTAIVVEQLGVDDEQVKSEATFKDLSADSLDLVEMMMTIEDRFGITVADDEAERLATVGDALALITQKMNAPAQT